MRLVAKTFKNLEPVCAYELRQLGANDVRVLKRAVSFSGGMDILYSANYCLRTASRVLVMLAEFDARDYDALYKQVKSIEWEHYLTANNTFSVSSTTYSEIFTNSQFVRYRVKDGIADYFRNKFGRRPNVDPENADIPIQVHIANTHCTILLDSSGQSLHKRGWREGQTAAPLNEALAAGLVLISGWKGNTPLLDPFCGSGTILIEAAMIAMGIQPGAYRKSFAFQKWGNYDHELFRLVSSNRQMRKLDVDITGSDISPRALKIAQQNINAAGLSRQIRLRQANAATLHAMPSPLTIITNPPYGIRLQGDDLNTLYHDFGKVIKFNMRGAEAWILSGDKNALKQIGLKPKSKTELLNGDIECLFQGYDIKP